MSLEESYKIKPSYLNDPLYTGHYYGKLSYEKSTDSWVIEGEPMVCQMAKRLFPGSSGKRAGQARFKRNKRTNGDLNWLMQRFPLEIIDKDRWNEDLNDTIQYTLKRQEIAIKPQKLVPSKTVFNGELKDFQKEGLAFLTYNPASLLADQMGLGKTVVALSWIAQLNQFPGIIVTPNNITDQWEKEINRFINKEVAVSEPDLFGNKEGGMVHVIKGLKPYELPPAAIYIIHYGLLRGWKNALPEYNFNFVVYDEIQELRHRQSEKYSAAHLLSESANHKIGLSGTPIFNYGGEIWNITNILQMHCLGDWDSFTREWCYGYGSDEVKDPVMLGDYLKREGIMLRRTKKDVFDEFPAKHRIVEPIDHDESAFAKTITEALQLLAKYDATEQHREKMALKGHIDRLARQATGVAKASSVAKFVKTFLEAGESVVVYVHHHEVYDIIQEELKEFNPLRISGMETKNQKTKNKEAFMNGESNLLLLALRGAQGIDGLQKRSHINVFSEIDWSPSVHSQAEDRLHRLGQEKDVYCYYPIIQTGTDEVMLDHLGVKTAQFVGIMGDSVETEEERDLQQSASRKHIEKVLEQLREKSKHLKVTT